MHEDDTKQNSAHANTDELLDYLNKASASDALSQDLSVTAMHIETCSQCQSELIALSSVGQTLFNHVDAPPSDAVWQKLQASLYGEQEPAAVVNQNLASQSDGSAELHVLRPSAHQSLSKAIYALAASVAFVGVVAVFMFSQQQSNSQQTMLMQASINELMINSRGLEESLQAVVVQNRALSEANQKVADRLYWKLTYVDQLIHDVAPDDSERVRTLWNDRVEALNELRQIYFERDSAREISEI